MHLQQPGLKYSACNSFTKAKERIKKIKETGDSRYIYQSELNKDCFQHDTVYANFKNLNRRISTDKVVRDKTFDIAKSLKYYEYQCRLASMVFKCYDKNFSSSGIKNENILNKQLDEEL